MFALFECHVIWVTSSIESLEHFFGLASQQVFVCATVVDLLQQLLQDPEGDLWDVVICPAVWIVAGYDVLEDGHFDGH